MAKTPNTTTAPTGQLAPFGLRMLPELKEQIEQAARESGRSMNAEIIARLHDSFATVRPNGGDRMIQELKKTQIQLEISRSQSRLETILEKAQQVAADLEKYGSEMGDEWQKSGKKVLSGAADVAFTVHARLTDLEVQLARLDGEDSPHRDEELFGLLSELETYRGKSRNDIDKPTTLQLDTRALAELMRYKPVRFSVAEMGSRKR